MITFLKGIIVGLGAVAPGLSGSILLVIFGLYHKIVATVSSIFKNFKKNILFLLPLAAGIGIGIIIFSKLISIPLEKFPMQTEYLFLGLVIGTVPMLFKEVRKEGFGGKYYIYIALAFAVGMLFFLGTGVFPEVKEANFLTSLLLGLAVAAAYLVPGVDSFAILSTFGLYNLWINSVGNLDFSVLIPAAIGLLIGGLAISFIFNKLFSRWYTATYSVIFGLFISVIINFVFTLDVPKFNVPSIVSIVLLFVGFAASLAFSQLEKFRKNDTQQQ